VTLAIVGSEKVARREPSRVERIGIIHHPLPGIRYVGRPWQIDKKVDWTSETIKDQTCASNLWRLDRFFIQPISGRLFVYRC
jgi:hypothetical protein